MDKIRITGPLAGELDYETALRALRDLCGAKQLAFVEQMLFVGEFPMPSQVWGSVPRRPESADLINLD